MTSREVVDRVERWFPGHKVGHAGTLDPLATGVLVLAVGSATRLIE
jgi:tRNA pseudouridine55 synthase